MSEWPPWQYEEASIQASLRRETLELELAAAREKIRPFYLLRPTISLEGNQWCYLHGEDLQSGIAGFGDTPEKAAIDFDVVWRNLDASNFKHARPTPTNGYQS